MNYWMWAYNKNLVKESELPRTYEDLLNPRWKGKITFANYTDWFATMYEILGEERAEKLFRGLEANDAFTADQFTPALFPVITGERELTISTVSGVLALNIKKGAPITGYFPDAPTVSRTQAVGWFPTGGNPAAGLLYAEFMLDPARGQAILAQRSRVPSHEAVAPNPPTLRPKQFLQVNHDMFAPKQAEWEKRKNDVLSGH